MVSINLSPKGSKSLIETLALSETLESIDLSSQEGLNRNRLGKESALPIEQLLTNPGSKLSSLSFENSYLSEECFQALCSGAISPFNQKPIQLSELNISKNDIKEGSMKFFI